MLADPFQAWLHMVQREQEEEEKERKKEEEERKRRAQEVKWRKRLLEAAFDGENDEIMAVLNEVHAIYTCSTVAFTIF